MNKRVFVPVAAMFTLAAAPSFAAENPAAASETPAAPAAVSVSGQADLEKQLDEARAQLKAAAHRMAELSLQLSEQGMRLPRLLSGARAFLGIDFAPSINENPERGARISSVTPGGPAEKAGLRAGDVITAINGTSIRTSDDESSVDRLIEFMQKVNPGDKLKIVYLRDGKNQTATVTAGDINAIVAGGMRAFMHRGVLGITVGSGDSAGVPVEGVTPGGPADQAGLQAGDVITAIDGAAVKPRGAASARDALLEVMDKVKPGDTVKVAYTRDGKTATVSVAAGNPRDYFFDFRMPALAALSSIMPNGSEPGTFRLVFGSGHSWDEMQLAPMNAGLGRYFGTDKGLLVLSAPKDFVLQLQSGDVILAIGGRDPGDPAHAMQILDTYEPGETLKLEIMRAGKPLTLDVTLPAPPQIANPL